MGGGEDALVEASVASDRGAERGGVVLGGGVGCGIEGGRGDGEDDTVESQYQATLLYIGRREFSPRPITATLPVFGVIMQAAVVK